MLHVQRKGNSSWIGLESSAQMRLFWQSVVFQVLHNVILYHHVCFRIDYFGQRKGEKNDRCLQFHLVNATDSEKESG